MKSSSSPASTSSASSSSKRPPVVCVREFQSQSLKQFQSGKLSLAPNIPEIRALPPQKVHAYFTEGLEEMTKDKSLPASKHIGIFYLAQQLETMEYVGRIIDQFEKLNADLRANAPIVDSTIADDVNVSLMHVISDNIYNWKIIAQEVLHGCMRKMIYAQSQTTEFAYLFWHAMDEMRLASKKYKDTLERILAPRHVQLKTALRKNITTYADGLLELSRKKDILECQDDIAFYAYRFKQFVTAKNGVISAIPIEMERRLAVTGFKDACTHYRNMFKRVFLMRDLKKSTAIQALCDIQKIVSCDEVSEFSFNPALPIDMQEQLLDLIKHDSDIFVSPYPDKITQGTIVEFINLCGAEKNIRDTVFFLNDFIANAEQKNDTQAIRQLSITQVQKEMSESKIEPMSHAEMVARDKKRLKELEQFRRQKNEEEKAGSTKFAFAKEMEKLSLQQQAEKKEKQKEILQGKIQALSSTHQRLLEDLLDPEQKAHNHYDEAETTTLLADLGVIEKTTQGFKIQIDNNITTTHRSHDKKLDGNFVEKIRLFFEDAGVRAKELNSPAPH